MEGRLTEGAVGQHIMRRVEPPVRRLGTHVAVVQGIGRRSSHVLPKRRRVGRRIAVHVSRTGPRRWSSAQVGSSDDTGPSDGCPGSRRHGRLSIGADERLGRPALAMPGGLGTGRGRSCDCRRGCRTGFGRGRGLRHGPPQHRHVGNVLEGNGQRGDTRSGGSQRGRADASRRATSPGVASVLQEGNSQLSQRLHVGLIAGHALSVQLHRAKLECERRVVSGTAKSGRDADASLPGLASPREHSKSLKCLVVQASPLDFCRCGISRKGRGGTQHSGAGGGDPPRPHLGWNNNVTSALDVTARKRRCCSFSLPLARGSGLQRGTAGIVETEKKKNAAKVAVPWCVPAYSSVPGQSRTRGPAGAAHVDRTQTHAQTHVRGEHTKAHGWKVPVLRCSTGASWPLNTHSSQKRFSRGREDVDERASSQARSGARDARTRVSGPRAVSSRTRCKSAVRTKKLTSPARLSPSPPNVYSTGWGAPPSLPASLGFECAATWEGRGESRVKKKKKNESSREERRGADAGRAKILPDRHRSNEERSANTTWPRTPTL
ncbi:hypothetical protein HPB48_006062 [Haemaphysalis longicornis]|uniref:Uncharacterized protein n=1 Tax=Haemaphysalis longicornis TaxID=44386 RepID=A0A9J6GLA1_HAELO|nr:hypothetical protein HPB48_006062 [Haemaphysalis longicornis]